MRRVLKFGGTSIESADRIRRAAENIARLLKEGDQVAVVVSAQGNDTNLLLSAAYTATDHHIDPQSLYRIAALGEEKSAHLLTAALRSLAIEAAAFLPTGADWPLIVDSPGDTQGLLVAQKINEERDLVLREEESRLLCGRTLLPLLRRGGVPVLSGFFGRSSRGDLTTFGRGGSDISGVLCGRCLDAEEVTIVTDVEGILSADPRLAQDPRLIEEMTVAELEVMASRGARVVHPRALRYKTDSCRVRVVDFRRQEELSRSGTTLTGTSREQLFVRAEELAMLTIVGKDLAPRTGLLARTAGVLGAEGIPIAAATQNDSYMCFYLVAGDGERAYRLLHDFLRDEAQGALTNITLRHKVAELRLRSPAFLQTPGVISDITAALLRRRINILEMITSQTDIYVYVDESDREAASQLLRPSA